MIITAPNLIDKSDSCIAINEKYTKMPNIKYR